MFSLSLGAGLRQTPRTGAARRGGAFAYSRLLHTRYYTVTHNTCDPGSVYGGDASASALATNTTGGSGSGGAASLALWLAA